MADQSYVFFNSLIDVDLIKIDQNLAQTFNQAVANKENMNATTTLFNTFDDDLLVISIFILSSEKHST